MSKQKSSRGNELPDVFLVLEGNMLKTTINQVYKHVGEEVTIGAWVANKRSSGKIAFLQLREVPVLFRVS